MRAPVGPANVQTLPGTPPPSLEALYEALTPLQRDALLPHLLGDTSADWVAGALRLAGCTISATTIRAYRRSLQ